MGFVFSWILLAAMPVSIVYAAYTAEYRLLQDHFNDSLNTRIRPVTHPTLTLWASVSMILGAVVELNDQDQALTTSGWLQVRWKNMLIGWDPADYDGMTSILLPVSGIWVPDIVTINSLDNVDSIASSFANAGSVVVTHEGDCFWMTAVYLTTACVLHMTYFPADEQTCHIELTSWKYDERYVNWTLDDNDGVQFVEGMYMFNSGWDVLSSQAQITRNDGKVTSTPIHPRIRFGLHLRRKPVYYVMHMLVPLMFMSLLIPLVFLLRPDGGEMFSFAVTVFLSFTIILVIVLEQLPMCTASPPIISILIMAAMGVTTLDVYCLVFLGRKVKDDETFGRLYWALFAIHFVVVIILIVVFPCIVFTRTAPVGDGWMETDFSDF